MQKLNFSTGIVAFNHGAFGGAARRISNLYFYLQELYPEKFYYFINQHLYEQLRDVYPHRQLKNILIINDEINVRKSVCRSGDNNYRPSFYKDTIPDPEKTDRETSLLRKIYWFYKNRNRQKRIFNRIEKFRKKFDIRVFNGISAGALPLVFYLEKTRRDTAVVFSDPDSWFTDVHSDMNKLWYRKYYSYNELLEKADVVDFLSPYIAEGVKNLGIKIKPDNLEIAPCSFIDYKALKTGTKDKMMIAFSSRLEPDKNPMLYLEAADEISEKYNNIIFYILGEGSLVNEIEEYINKNNLKDKIIFKFSVSPADILADTSIFVSLQSATNYPSQSVLEAMACGNAVIASNRGDTGLIVNNENGILIKLNNVELVNAMRTLIDNRYLCTKLGNNGKKFVMENHTIGKYTSYYLKILYKAYSKIYNG